MNTALLQRIDQGDQGTFGKFYLPNYACYSGELPWRDNKSNISCVPVGKYKVVWALSPRLRKYTYRLIDVEDRGGILIHSSNLMGDSTLGFKAQLLGCISLGERLGTMEGQKALLLSKPAIRRLEEIMQQKPFMLEIQDAW